MNSGIPRGYILENQITHARLLPAKSAHAFGYFMLSFLVSLDALESRQLDLGYGWLFSYGGLWGRLTGIRPRPYLAADANKSIRQKLETLLKDRGCFDDGVALQDTWMMTMPSYLGFEGINPLTVYFCYKSDGQPWLVVLEIHNTFGESHVHVLTVGKDEDSCETGYDHVWTFKRAFHVSPFNDRSGFYTVAVKFPSASPSASSPLSTPLPKVRVHLHTKSLGSDSRPGELKLAALLRPTSTIPLTSTSLISALARAPITLLLSFPRILYHAWILHYRKRLDVYIRPEPIPSSGGVRWLPASPLEAYARQRAEAFLEQAVEATGISVTLHSADPMDLTLSFIPATRASRDHLDITYLSPRFFSILFVSPSAEIAFAMGNESEGIFTASSRELFVEIFEQSTKEGHLSLRQWLRCLPFRGKYHLEGLKRRQHPLDSDCVTWPKRILSFTSLLVVLVLAKLEEWIFRIAKARIVVGDEPWQQWDRTVQVMLKQTPTRLRPHVGSVLNEE